MYILRMKGLIGGGRHVLVSKKDSNGGAAHRCTMKVARGGAPAARTRARPRCGGASASATEALQARFQQWREEGGRQWCGIEGGDVKGGGTEVGQPNGAKPKGLHD
jgi:hypothetical protein